jgi:murein DD-endopeptidase MepM/ murein hydrolase activator NlpD
VEALGGGQLLIGGLMATVLGLSLLKVTASNATAAPAPPAALALAPALAPARVPPLRPPVEAPVVKPFDMTHGVFKRGHRGVDLVARPGTVVTSPAPGIVRFAGRVAGLGWVTIEVQPKVLVTVGPLDHIVVHAGDQVGALTPLGMVQAGHGDGVHLGVRVDGLYVDPLPHLVHMGAPHLVPLSTIQPVSVSPPQRGWRIQLSLLPTLARRTFCRWPSHPWQPMPCAACGGCCHAQTVLGGQW